MRDVIDRVPSENKSDPIARNENSKLQVTYGCTKKLVEQLKIQNAGMEKLSGIIAAASESSTNLAQALNHLQAVAIIIALLAFALTGVELYFKLTGKI